MLLVPCSCFILCRRNVIIGAYKVVTDFHWIFNSGYDETESCKICNIPLCIHFSKERKGPRKSTRGVSDHKCSREPSTGVKYVILVYDRSVSNYATSCFKFQSDEHNIIKKLSQPSRFSLNSRRNQTGYLLGDVLMVAHFCKQGFSFLEISVNLSASFRVNGMQCVFDFSDVRSGFSEYYRRNFEMF